MTPQAPRARRWPALGGWLLALRLGLLATAACVVRDDAAPETFVHSDLAPLTGDLVATFEFHADEPLATFRCGVDEGALEACTSPHTTGELGDGAHTFYVAAVDVAGNQDPTPASLAWVIDSNLPRLQIAGPPALSAERASLFAITASKPVADFLCAMDGATPVPCTMHSATAAEFAHEASDDGAFTLRVQATDAVGYVATAAYAWQIDATPPTLTVPNPPAAINNLSSLTIGFASDEPLAVATCSFDGGAASACAALSYSRGNLAEGQHSVTLAAQDLAGNAASKTVSWRTDKTKPVLVVEPLNGKWSVTANETTHVVATGLNATIAAGQIRSWGTLPSSVGNHAITVTGTDVAGNVRQATGYHCVDNPSGTVCD